MLEGRDPVDLFMSLDRWPLSPLEEEEETDREMYMVGFVIVNVVGLQYYTGTISGREIVGLQREPLNQYDSNAIKVLNTRSIQVGHIERSAAMVLAPLLDAHVITIDGKTHAKISFSFCCFKNPATSYFTVIECLELVDGFLIEIVE